MAPTPAAKKPTVKSPPAKKVVPWYSCSTAKVKKAKAKKAFAATPRAMAAAAAPSPMEKAKQAKEHDVRIKEAFEERIELQYDGFHFPCALSPRLVMFNKPAEDFDEPYVHWPWSANLGGKPKVLVQLMVGWGKLVVADHILEGPTLLEVLASANELAVLRCIEETGEPPQDQSEFIKAGDYLGADEGGDYDVRACFMLCPGVLC